jgi:hypothetical protein
MFVVVAVCTPVTMLSSQSVKDTLSLSAITDDAYVQQAVREMLSDSDEDDIGQCTLLQRPSSDIVSRSPAALADILDRLVESQDSISVYDGEDVDTPALSPASDFSSIDDTEHALCTPLTDERPLADLTPKVSIDAGLGITHVEEEHELPLEDAEIYFDEFEATEESMGFSMDQADEIDAIDAHIATVTGYTPRKFVLTDDVRTANTEQVSFKEDEELDDIDAMIASVTDYSPTRSTESLWSTVQLTPTKPMLDIEALAESPEQMSFAQDDSLDDIDARIATVTGYSPTRAFISDYVDARILAATGYSPTRDAVLPLSSVPSTPTKPVLDAANVMESPERVSATGYDELDEIDAKIEAVTGYSPTRAPIVDDIDARIAAITGCSISHSSQVSSSCSQQTTWSPCPEDGAFVDSIGQMTLDDIDAAFEAVAELSLVPNSYSLQDDGLGKLGELDNIKPMIEDVPIRNSTLSDCDALDKMTCHRQTGPQICSRNSLDTLPKPSKTQGPSQVMDKRTGIPLPRTLSAPALVLRSRTTRLPVSARNVSGSKAAGHVSRTVSLNTVSTHLESRKTAASSRIASTLPSVSPISTATSSKPHPLINRSSSTKPSPRTHSTSSNKLRPSTRHYPSTATPRRTALPPVAPLQTRSTPSRKMLVSFSPTSTPSPQARAMWRSLAAQSKTKTKTASRPTLSWKP